ncbi:MAG TPA: sugar phosphate isomerase/epimerase family protein [Phycisphaerae bacterium]|nr:sugar phosphate isomerase/epimerase family protein [Phycisphaerae bacterium]
MKRKFKIGVMSDCLGLGPEGGVKKAAELGADGVQVWTTGGKMSPEQMNASGRAGFKALCADLGLQIASLCGDLGAGFHNPQTNPQNIERTKRIIDLAVDLGTKVVTTHIGVVPENPGDAAYRIMLAACREMAEHAAGKGVTFAVETGPEKAVTLRRFLDDVGSPGIGVNLDPANLVMVVADDPVAAVHTLEDYIVHTHAKDGIRLRPTDAAKTYSGRTPPELGPGFKEVPLGEGGVRWDDYLDALSEIGYTGYLTIEREVGKDPVGDIARAITFLCSKMK